MERKSIGKKRTTSHGRKKTVHRKKRRVSGANDIGGQVMQGLELGAGALGARALNNFAVKLGVPGISTSPIMSGVVQIGAGILVKKMIKKPWAQNVGNGAMANGGMVIGVTLLAPTGLVSGIGRDVMSYNLGRSLTGVNNLPMVAGVNNLPVVAGAPPQVLNRSRGGGIGKTFRTIIR